MSKVQQLRALVKQRLTAAAEEIFGLFERTIADYEEEASGLKEENDRQRKLLDAVLNPEVRLHRAEVQQLLVSKEEVPPEQQDWSPSLDQEDPETPHMKEEQEELWTGQEGERLQGPEEADITEFPFTPVPVKSEDDEEKPQSSQLHQSQTEENREAEPLASSSTEQMKTEADGEDCGVSEPARNLDPASHLQATSDGNTSHSSEPETEDSDDYEKETREPQSGLDSLKNNEVLISHKRSYTGEKPFSCSDCGKRFDRKGSLQRHMRVHTGDKPFSCSVCGKIFSQSRTLRSHMRIHTGEKPFSCSDCDRSFRRKGHLKTHMRVHTGEKPFSCSDCGKRFGHKVNLNTHMRVHTGEKPFSCSDCGKSFGHKVNLNTHMRVHTGEKPFSCSDCDKRFHYKQHLKRHTRVHTGEKPFSCSDCGKSFGRKVNLKTHMKIHTGEKPFSCSVCKKTFTRRGQMVLHMRVHTGEKPYSCSVCFLQRSHVKQHKSSVHVHIKHQNGEKMGSQ
ncbi:zinc finger protein OZF-like [Centroberyx affinis]|uniref:zinc finger protein OZF-like n=1 Tax=Centroberyx affinis TaxID=166261 RepID=UPI003A5BDF0C